MTGRGLLVWAEIADLVAAPTHSGQEASSFQRLQVLAESAARDSIGWSSWVPHYLLASCYLANLSSYHPTNGGADIPNLFIHLMLSRMPEAAETAAGRDGQMYEKAAEHLDAAMDVLFARGVDDLLSLEKEEQIVALMLQDELMREITKTFRKLNRFDKCFEAVQFQRACSLISQMAGLQEEVSQSRSYSDFGSGATAKLQAALRPGDVIVDFYIYELVEDTAVITLLKKDSVFTMEIPISWRSSDESKRDSDLRLLLGAHDPTADRLTAISEQLAELIIRPWAKSVVDAERLLLVPHNYLHNIPLHLELRGKSAERSVAYLPLATAYGGTAAPITKESLSKCLFVGYAPDGDINIHRDLEILRSCIPDIEVLMHEQATVANVIKSLKNADLVYFACHGGFSKEDYAAYLILHDNNLTAGDILSRGRGGPIKLVILNGCYTGTAGRTYSRGDQKLSLHTAFMLTGATYVLASFWKVRDSCAISMIDSFFSSMFHGDRDVEGSYSVAISEAVGDVVCGDPTEWAAFAIFGPSDIQVHKGNEDDRNLAEGA